MSRKQMARIPEELKKLQKPWFKGRNIDPEVEGWVRKGAQVSKTPLGYMLTVYRTGAAGTMKGYVIGEKEAKQFFEIQKKEYFAESEFKEAGRKAREKLDKFLLERKVRLTLNAGFPYELIEMTRIILSILPEHHLGHEHFNELTLGGWNSGAYKGARGSAYHDPEVHIFTFATSGPKRNFIGLLLHEIGHSFEELLSTEDKGKLLELYHSVPKLGIDYLYGEEERKKRQKISLSEFIAENYLIYVTQGKRFARFVSSLDSDQKTKWIDIMEIYMRNFDDKFYV